MLVENLEGDRECPIMALHSPAMVSREELGFSLKRVRQARRMSTQQTAALLKTSVKTLYRWENGDVPDHAVPAIEEFLEAANHADASPTLANASNLQLVGELLRRLEAVEQRGDMTLDALQAQLGSRTSALSEALQLPEVPESERRGTRHFEFPASIPPIDPLPDEPSGDEPEWRSASE